MLLRCGWREAQCNRCAQRVALDDTVLRALVVSLGGLECPERWMLSESTPMTALVDVLRLFGAGALDIGLSALGAASGLIAVQLVVMAVPRLHDLACQTSEVLCEGFIPFTLAGRLLGAIVGGICGLALSHSLARRRHP